MNPMHDDILAVALIGWAAWGAVALGIAAFDIALARFKHTTLSETWLHGSQNKVIRPFELATFATLGSHLFYGTSIWLTIGSAIATGAAVAVASLKGKSQ